MTYTGGYRITYYTIRILSDTREVVLPFVR